MSSLRLARSFGVVFLPCALALFACSTGPGQPPSLTGGVSADQVEIVAGVSDQGRDPAVLALDVAGAGLCTATLIAPDVALTARHCVSKTVASIQCPSATPQVTSAHAPSALTFLMGDDVTTGTIVAHGKKIFTPAGDMICDADIALVVLDQPVDGIDPLTLSTAAASSGAFVTAVGYGRAGDNQPAGMKLLREHVAILDATATEFTVGEATCQGDSGGPALDETSGDVIGVVSRGGPTCDGAGVHNVYTQVSAFASLIAQALAYSSAPKGKAAKDAGAKATSGPSDLGLACTQGSDCPTGVCVTDATGSEYCSRTCGTGDRCPSGFRCTGAQNGSKVCIEDGKPKKPPAGDASVL